MPTTEGGWTTAAPSAVAFDGFDAPVALDLAGIDRVVEAFAAAARRAVDAGFDVLEIHGAHGYLLHQFLSPLSNLRDDEYGGSLENRARLLLRVIDAVREAAGDDLPLFVRISATDHADGGFTPEEAATVGDWAVQHSADLIDVSSGGLVAHQWISVFPGYQVPLAETVRQGGRIPVSAVGLITAAAQAERVLADGAADAIFAGREWLRDPHFALRAAHELDADIAWPPQYERAPALSLLGTMKAAGPLRGPAAFIVAIDDQRPRKRRVASCTSPTSSSRMSSRNSTAVVFPVRRAPSPGADPHGA